jgi:hypothetical protein
MMFDYLSGSRTKAFVFSAVAVLAVAVSISMLLPEEEKLSKEEILLYKCEKAISVLQQNLIDLNNKIQDEASRGDPSLERGLTACALDSDFILETLDKVQCSNNSELRARRKLFVERVHELSEVIDKLRTAV